MFVASFFLLLPVLQVRDSVVEGHELAHLFELHVDGADGVKVKTVRVRRTMKRRPELLCCPVHLDCALSDERVVAHRVLELEDARGRGRIVDDDHQREIFLSFHSPSVSLCVCVQRTALALLLFFLARRNLPLARSPPKMPTQCRNGEEDGDKTTTKKGMK